MRIAVVHHINAGDYAEYLASLLNNQAVQNDYVVKVWSYSIPASQQLIPENAIVYIVTDSNSRLALKWWYAVKLPAVLKKIKAGAVIDLNGIASLKNSVPKMIALSQELFSGKKLRGVNKLAQEQIVQSIAGSGKVLVYSHDKISAAGDESRQKKMEVIPFTAPAAFRTFEWHEKIMIKAQQADNKEYFISVLEDDAEEDFVTLLKAFTKFKNWQQSSMQFLILPKYESFISTIHQKLEKYTLRQDVRLLEDLDETQLASVFASAYAMVLMWSVQPDLVVLTAALQCSLPVISLSNVDVKEYADDAALYANEKSVEALGNALKQLYKDEGLHAQLKEASKKRSALFNRDEYEAGLWKLLQTAAYSWQVDNA